MYKSSERGIAMITTLLVMMLISALLVGFTAVVMSDQRYRFIDRDRGQAFYAATGALEKLTADLGNLFFTNLSPKGTDVLALTNMSHIPTIAGVTYAASNAPQALPASQLTSYHCAPTNVPARTPTIVGVNGYTVMFCADANGNPSTADQPTPVTTGPYEGLIAEKIPYQLDITSRTATGGETHLVRTIEGVAIPVFQFGMFSDVDLSFFAGPDFNFGGRVHTNGNLFLAQGDGATLTLTDKVTAVKDIIRQRLQNNASIDLASAHTGTVNMAKASGVYTPMLRTWGSLVDGLGSALNEPTWHTTSLSTYNSWIRDGATGAKALNLPLLTVGGTNPDLIRRAPVGENVSNPVLFGERMYSKASIRILLSDTAADITGLPTVTSTAPVQLDGNWKTTAPNNGTAYGPVDATHPPVALSNGATTVVTSANTVAGANTITVAAMPAYFTTATGLTITQPAGGGTVYTTTCTQRDGTNSQLKNCAGTAGATTQLYPVGSTVALTINGAVVQSKTTVAILALTNPPTITLTPGTVNAFIPGAQFWMPGTTAIGGLNVPITALVSCNGNTSTTVLTQCSGVPTSTSPVTLTSAYLSNVNTGLLGGYLKVEEQDQNGNWTDITMQILNYGIGAPNIEGQICNDPTPNAILRLQRLKDNGGGTPNGTLAAGTLGGGCSYAQDPTGIIPALTYGSSLQVPTNWWPQALFDTREGVLRDCGTSSTATTTQCTDPGVLTVGGVMYYIALDVNNLTKWFAGVAPYAAGTGPTGKKDNGGFTVYFSDRRNNRNVSNQETSEYGWEDFVNPASPTGAPSGILDAGEDLNANTVLDVYGGVTNYNGAYGATPPGALAPLNNGAGPTTTLTRGQAEVNRSVLFRHALKLINGANIVGNGVTGLAIVAENPVYIQGDYNAGVSPATNGFPNNAHAATSVIADAVTLLSNQWTDLVSFTNPYNPGARPRNDSWYRTAIISGKGSAFPLPAVGNPANDFGTDGGAHNFLRYLESGATLNYRGSIATFFYNRQAVGTYKCCTTVYNPPTRNYNFDTDFLTPALLPPNTPVFRDMNAVGFSQELRPGR